MCNISFCLPASRNYKIVNKTKTRLEKRSLTLLKGVAFCKIECRCKESNRNFRSSLRIFWQPVSIPLHWVFLVSHFHVHMAVMVWSFCWFLLLVSYFETFCNSSWYYPCFPGFCKYSNYSKQEHLQKLVKFDNLSEWLQLVVPVKYKKIMAS